MAVGLGFASRAVLGALVLGNSRTVKALKGTRNNGSHAAGTRTRTWCSAGLKRAHARGFKAPEAPKPAAAGRATKNALLVSGHSD